MIPMKSITLSPLEKAGIPPKLNKHTNKQHSQQKQTRKQKPSCKILMCGKISMQGQSVANLLLPKQCKVARQTRQAGRDMKTNMNHPR